jgi:hypothetical protein
MRRRRPPLLAQARNARLNLLQQRYIISHLQYIRSIPTCAPGRTEETDGREKVEPQQEETPMRLIVNYVLPLLAAVSTSGLLLSAAIV